MGSNYHILEIFCKELAKSIEKTIMWWNVIVNRGREQPKTKSITPVDGSMPESLEEQNIMKKICVVS